jgi:hypothetical protein
VQKNSGGGLHEVDRRPASLCDPIVLRQLAGALGDVAAFYEVPTDPIELVAWAIDRSQLVMMDRFPKQVNWDGKPVAESQWDKSVKEWDLLWKLARCPGKFVTQDMLVDPEKQAIGSRRYRLGKLLDGSELDGHIENVRGEGYRLNIDRSQIILLHEGPSGNLEFELGQPAGIN